MLKAHDEAKNRTGLDLAINGQEKDVATTALAKMNMILHDCTTAEIAQGIFLVDASKGFLKDSNKNRLRDQDIHKMVVPSRVWPTLRLETVK